MNDRGETITETAPKARREAAFGFIFASALMNSISFGIMIPILPNLIRQFTGGDTAAASEWNLFFGATWGVMQFFFGPILGMLSDRVGRRPVLLISFFGLAIDFLFMAFAPTLWWLYVGRVLNGMTASSFSTAGAYIADISPPERRAKTFGMLTSAFSFGFIIGPTVGGLLGQHDLRLPFLAAAALTALNFLYGLVVLPESLPPERRLKSFQWRRANPVGALGMLRTHPGLLGLAGVGFLFQLSQVVLPTVFVLYTTYRYGWTPQVLGFTFLLTGVLGVIVQMFLVGPIVARIGERRTVLLGAAIGTLGFLWYGWAPQGWIYLIGAPVFALSGLMMPGLQGLMTRRVPANQQGQLQGAMQSLQGFASIFGPVVFGETFAWSLRHDSLVHAPGLAVYLAAGLLGLAFTLAIGAARAEKAEPQPAIT
jgi:DHA1 family tetracycline resistance protein-like MFS transporter